MVTLFLQIARDKEKAEMRDDDDDHDQHLPKLSQSLSPSPSAAGELINKPTDRVGQGIRRCRSRVAH